MRFLLLLFVSICRFDRNAVPWECTAEERKGCSWKRFASNSGDQMKPLKFLRLVWILSKFTTDKKKLLVIWLNLIFHLFRRRWINLRHKQIKLENWWRRMPWWRACKTCTYFFLSLSLTHGAPSLSLREFGGRNLMLSCFCVFFNPQEGPSWK